MAGYTLPAAERSQLNNVPSWGKIARDSLIIDWLTIGDICAFLLPAIIAMNEEGDHHSVNDRGALRQMNIMFRFVHNDQQSRLRMPTNQQKKQRKSRDPRLYCILYVWCFLFSPAYRGLLWRKKNKQTCPPDSKNAIKRCTVVYCSGWISSNW